MKYYKDNSTGDIVCFLSPENVDMEKYTEIPEPIPEKKITENVINIYIQNWLDKKAQSLGYDSMLSARGWANVTTYDRQNEAKNLSQWAGAVWSFIRSKKTDFLDGTIVLHKIEDLDTLIPVYNKISSDTPAPSGEISTADETPQRIENGEQQ